MLTKWYTYHPMVFVVYFILSTVALIIDAGTWVWWQLALPLVLIWVSAYGLAFFVSHKLSHYGMVAVRGFAAAVSLAFVLHMVLRSVNPLILYTTLVPFGMVILPTYVVTLTHAWAHVLLLRTRQRGKDQPS